jgi:hypothetical protein
MKTSFWAAFMFFVSVTCLQAQDEQPASLLRQNNIKRIEAYFFSPDSPSTPNLITVEEFNTAGRRTKIEIYDSTGMAGYYEYLFKDDTVKYERRTYSKDKFQSTTKITNDALGNEWICKDYDEKGNETGLHSLATYNKQNLLADYKFFIYSRLAGHTTYKYFPNGDKKQIQYLVPLDRRETIRLDASGNQINSKHARTIKEVETLEMESRKKVITTIIRHYPATIIGVGGWLELKENDKDVKETYYSFNGLLDFEVQYVNGVCIGKKKYYYFEY